MADARPYELMVILEPGLDDENVQRVLDRHLAVVGDRGGEVAKVDHWGRRKFAYEINHRTEGIYAVAELRTDPETVSELERLLRLADEVIRHKVVRPGKD